MVTAREWIRRDQGIPEPEIEAEGRAIERGRVQHARDLTDSGRRRDLDASLGTGPRVTRDQGVDVEALAQRVEAIERRFARAAYEAAQRGPVTPPSPAPAVQPRTTIVRPD